MLSLHTLHSLQVLMKLAVLTQDWWSLWLYRHSTCCVFLNTTASPLPLQTQQSSLFSPLSLSALCLSLTTPVERCEAADAPSGLSSPTSKSGSLLSTSQPSSKFYKIKVSLSISPTVSVRPLWSESAFVQPLSATSWHISKMFCVTRKPQNKTQNKTWWPDPITQRVHTSQQCPGETPFKFTRSRFEQQICGREHSWCWGWSSKHSSPVLPHQIQTVTVFLHGPGFVHGVSQWWNQKGPPSNCWHKVGSLTNVQLWPNFFCPPEKKIPVCPHSSDHMRNWEWSWDTIFIILSPNVPCLHFSLSLSLCLSPWCQQCVLCVLLPLARSPSSPQSFSRRSAFMAGRKMLSCSRYLLRFLWLKTRRENRPRVSRNKKEKEIASWEEGDKDPTAQRQIGGDTALATHKRENHKGCNSQSSMTFVLWNPLVGFRDCSL